MLDRNAQITPHFAWHELLRPQDPDPPQDIQDNLFHLCLKLEDVRYRNAGPIHINSGYRTHEHQAQLYAVDHGKQPVAPAGHSQHELGKAVDISGSTLNKALIDWLWQESANPKLGWTGGMGKYPFGIHLDIGPKRRWEE